MKASTEISICPMTRSDLESVLAIESVSFPHPWTEKHFLDELESQHSLPLVALTGDGTITGYICPMLVLDEGHILDVAVHPDARGRGVGKMLVEQALFWCRQGGASFVSLEVRPSNVQAIELYRNLGFEVTGIRKRYYHDGEDALMMEYIYPAGQESVHAV